MQITYPYTAQRALWVQRLFDVARFKLIIPGAEELTRSDQFFRCVSNPKPELEDVMNHDLTHGEGSMYTPEAKRRS